MKNEGTSKARWQSVLINSKPVKRHPVNWLEYEDFGYRKIGDDCRK